jgi:hypothetical protein
MPRVLNYKTDGLPPGAVYIGRTNPRYRMPASKWRNPYRIGRDGTRDEVIDQYRRFICESSEGASLRTSLHELRGRDLVCWCAPAACHGDVLLELANARPGALAAS